MANEKVMKGDVMEFASNMKKIVNNKEHRYDCWSRIHKPQTLFIFCQFNCDQGQGLINVESE